MPKIETNQAVTDVIWRQMKEQGTDWIKPFAGSGSDVLPVNPNYTTPREYHGSNVIMLWMQPYADNRWGTYRQWQESGRQVEAGQKSTAFVVYAGKAKSKTKKDPKTGNAAEFFFLRRSAVFNNQQLTEDTRMPDPTPVKRDPIEVNAQCDAYVKATGAKIEHSTKGQAYYAPGPDRIHLPNPDQFIKTPTSTREEAYQSTRFHELGHWTGHASRLDRLGKSNGFGDASYAFEELVAELSAAFQCAKHGVSVEPRADHAKYLNNWLKMLEEKPKAFHRAASLASKAVAFCDELQPGQAQEVAA